MKSYSYLDGFKIDSRIKSQSALGGSDFKMRKIGIKNTYDAGVKIINKYILHFEESQMKYNSLNIVVMLC